MQINIQKSMAVLYTNNEPSVRETKKTIHLLLQQQKIKCLGINLTKEVKDLYSDNYRTLKKEVEEHANKWKCIACSWIGRISIIKMSIHPKQSINSMEFLSKYQWHISQI